jgi:UDP:flavonoid glycosyltransferase YjiC (YdhE family)
MLRERGEEVVCAFPEQYRNIAEENGFCFHSLGGKFLDILESKNGKLALSGKGFAKFVATLKMSMRFMGIQHNLIGRQKEIMDELNPDIVIRHSKVLSPLPYCIKNQTKSILLALQPGIFHEVRDMAQIGFSFLPPKLSYKLIHFAITKSAMMAVNDCCKGEITQKQISASLKQDFKNARGGAFLHTPEKARKYATSHVPSRRISRYAW